jgi:hypothetical protein
VGDNGDSIEAKSERRGTNFWIGNTISKSDLLSVTMIGQRAFKSKILVCAVI